MTTAANIVSNTNTATCTTVAQLRQHIKAWQKQNLTVGFVPTMGALHVGHMSLVEIAKKTCDRVVVSIFVNPTQFNRPDDLANYPRLIDQDMERCRNAAADLVFHPDVKEVYPGGYNSKVQVGDITGRWEGNFRPGHFDGMSTVVCKLFNMVTPTHAFFGEKDFQQLQVIRAMVRDLNIPIEIIGCPTIREKDGLACSSRNMLLKPEHRAIAPAFYASLIAAAKSLRAGEDPGKVSVDIMTELRKAGFDKIDYIGVADNDMLQPLTAPAKSGRILGAAWLGNVRLIDNIDINEGA
ncbi:MAG: pantoate--beta-alanine ligase [Alphaproteobacteria bacterium]|nr:MAG: pantoate--beta-alanine ligase [Alphaproteobacteria bacterium]